MSIISAFCKKGGVGKTTIIAFLAHYYAKQGKQVLVISADDQNSIFKVFGCEDKVFERNDNYLEFLMSDRVDYGDVLIDVRENLYLVKTLNTNKLSIRLTSERSKEKVLKRILDEFEKFFDYIFIDFPPSGSRLCEVLLDISDYTLVVVGLDCLGLDGFFNTIQYFVDSDIDLDTIKYVFPNGFAVNRRAPKVSLEKLKEQAKDFIPNAVVLPALQDKSIIKNLQAEGISPFDDVALKPYDQTNKNLLEKELNELFSHIDFSK